MDSYLSLGVHRADVDTSSRPFLIAYLAIYQLCKQVIRDTNFLSEFSQAWIGGEFELGDELTQYNCTQHSAVSGGVEILRDILMRFCDSTGFDILNRFVGILFTERTL